MSREDKHLWYRVQLGENSLAYRSLDSIPEKKETVVPISSAPAWMLNKIALVKLTKEDQEIREGSPGGRVGKDVFYIRRDRSE